MKLKLERNVIAESDKKNTIKFDGYLLCRKEEVVDWGCWAEMRIYLNFGMGFVGIYKEKEIEYVNGLVKDTVKYYLVTKYFHDLKDFFGENAEGMVKDLTREFINMNESERFKLEWFTDTILFLKKVNSDTIP